MKRSILVLYFALVGGIACSQDCEQWVSIEPGTDNTAYAPSTKGSGSIFDGWRNAAYIGLDFGATLTLNYERLLPVGEQFGYAF